MLVIVYLSVVFKFLSLCRHQEGAVLDITVLDINIKFFFKCEKNLSCHVCAQGEYTYGPSNVVF